MDEESLKTAAKALRHLLEEGAQETTIDVDAPTASTHWTTDVNGTSTEAALPEGEPLAPYAIASASVLILFCVITLACNAVILASVSWIRRPMSPTLSLSISLAAADAYNALFLGTGLLVNSLLPRVIGESVEDMAHGRCILLGFEALRVGGIFVSVAHLLALAVNHYLGILRPLHYAATLTPRITTILIIFLWKIPIAFFFVYFSSISGQGFQSPHCEYAFIKQLGFRAVFSCLFFAPLILMAFIYLHIYCIVRRTQCSRQRSRLGRQLDEGSRGLVRGSGRDSGRSRSESCRGRTPRARQLARNWKAVVTTMLILGTYILGWIPAVMLFLLVCDNCVLEFKDPDKRVMLAAYSFANLLIILKSLSDPIIYAARMQEIKAALGRMKETVFGIPVGAGSGPGASGVESNHGYSTRVRRRTRRGLAFCCCCCRSYRDFDHGFYGGEVMSRNRLSTYASSASGGAPVSTNMGLSFRVRSLQRHAINGRTEAAGDEILAEVVQVRDAHENEKAGILTAGHRVTVI
ncbi:beta-3 adrenergic receptor-like [Ischnura elegans]|uniref:beta-3 adrenergic receptor-like n=1 Tax=Ischnura elegans TaxID=197161 RepID=UPI001ED8B929|nr:beta-3 adrenergic receptor-like [Ischnura elegans]